MEFILICHHVLFVVLLMQSISLHISRGSAASAGGASNCSSYTVIDPPMLIVRINDPVSAICKPSQSCSNCNVGWETAGNAGTKTKSGNSSTWNMDIMNDWEADPICYDEEGEDCDSLLRIIAYKPPDSVSISYVNHTGPELEAQQYSLQCHVQDVAPVQNLAVTFYRGQTALAPPQCSDRVQRKPVSETFYLNVTSSIEDDGAVYWCEAKLDLGPDGPQTPPVVNSSHLTATVYYKPQREVLRQNITITAGDHLHLNCSTKSNPSPLYTWTSPPAASNLNRTSCCPTVDHITSDYGGEYTCFASNTAGNITVVFHVKVKVDLLPIVAGLAAVAVVVLMVVFGVVYSSHYRRTHMGRYTLRDMLPFRRSNHDVL